LVGVGVKVTVGGTGVGVNVGVAAGVYVGVTPLNSLAPTHALAGVLQFVMIGATSGSNTAAFSILRLSTPAAAALRFNTARGAETPAPEGRVAQPCAVHMQDMKVLPMLPPRSHTGSRTSWSLQSQPVPRSGVLNVFVPALASGLSSKEVPAPVATLVQVFNPES